MSTDASPYDFHLKTGDTSPAIEWQLTDDEGAAIDLTNVPSVSFVMMAPGEDTPTVDAAAQIATAVDGIVRYEWGAADTDTPGSYDAEFEITHPDGSYETFPDTGYISIRIARDLGGTA